MRYGQQQLRGCKLINYHETINVTLPALSSVSPSLVSLSADLGLNWPAFAPTLLSCFSPHHNEIWCLGYETHAHLKLLFLFHFRTGLKQIFFLIYNVFFNHFSIFYSKAQINIKCRNFPAKLTYYLSCKLSSFLFKQVFHLFDVEFLSLRFIKSPRELWEERNTDCNITKWTIML